jgi:hypothetical protein
VVAVAGSLNQFEVYQHGLANTGNPEGVHAPS